MTYRDVTGPQKANQRLYELYREYAIAMNYYRNKTAANLIRFVGTRLFCSGQTKNQPNGEHYYQTCCLSTAYCIIRIISRRTTRTENFTNFAIELEMLLFNFRSWSTLGRFIAKQSRSSVRKVQSGHHNLTESTR